MKKKLVSILVLLIIVLSILFLGCSELIYSGYGGGYDNNNNSWYNDNNRDFNSDTFDITVRNNCTFDIMFTLYEDGDKTTWSNVGLSQGNEDTYHKTYKNRDYKFGYQKILQEDPDWYMSGEFEFDGSETLDFCGDIID